MKIEYKNKLVVDFAAPNEAKKWTLVEPFVFKVDGYGFSVPTAFWTDFASIPRIVWPLISPYELGYGPIPHDFGYFTGIKSKEYWDDVFSAFMEKDNIAPWKRTVAYQSVDKFGGFTYDKYRRENAKHYAEALVTKSVILPSWTRHLSLDRFVI